MNFLRNKLSRKFKYELMENNKRLLAAHQYNFVILGTQQSGKSTLLQQFRIVCKTYTNLERLIFKENIANKILDSILGILEEMEKSTVYFKEPKLQEKADTFKSSLLQGGGRGHKYLREFASTISLFWYDRNLQSYVNKNIVDKSAEYFFNSLKTITFEDYLPSNKDICYYLFDNICSIESKNPIEEIKVVDKGVQRKFTAINKKSSTETKAIKALLASEGIIFCVSLLDFVAADGPKKIKEAKNSFDSILYMQSYCNFPVILLFTKKDLFEEKLKQNEFKEYFIGFKGDNSCNDVYKFILNMFYDEPLAKRRLSDGKLCDMAICTHNRSQIHPVLSWLQFFDDNHVRLG